MSEFDNLFGKSTLDKKEEPSVITKDTKKDVPKKKLTEIEKNKLKTTEKGIKTKASLHNIRKVLDDTNITQDDLWFLISYFTREKVSTFRESKKDLEPIFKDFINKKLNRQE